MKLFAILLVISMLPFGAFAVNEAPEADEVIYLEDGSYITVTLTESVTRVSGTKTASRTYRYYSSDDVEQWNATLRGTFTYAGSSATCTNATCSVSVLVSSWYEKSKSVYPSGNAAVGELTMGHKLLGITVGTKSITMRLTCDANGNLS